MDKTKTIVLYIGGLPKEAKASDVESNLCKITTQIKVNLSLKRNRKHCRGHGKIYCSTPETAELLLGRSHFLYGRKIVIENLKSKNEISQKYRNLYSRKVRIVISLPTTLIWNNHTFRIHFEKFGSIDIAHLKESPILYQGAMVLVGNVTFDNISSAEQLCTSQDPQEFGYRIERNFKTSFLPPFRQSEKSSVRERSDPQNQDLRPFQGVPRTRKKLNLLNSQVGSLREFRNPRRPFLIHTHQLQSGPIFHFNKDRYQKSNCIQEFWEHLQEKAYKIHHNHSEANLVWNR